MPESELNLVHTDILTDTIYVIINSHNNKLSVDLFQILFLEHSVF